jgi:hypothetical protein
MRSKTNVLPLAIDIPFQNFVNIYRQANITQLDTHVAELIQTLQPAFFLWQEVWLSKDYVTNINISSLINILKADNSPLGDINWKINTYNTWLSLNNLNLIDELNYCLLQHIRKEKHIYDYYYEEKNLLFFIAKDVKMFLFKKIRKVLSSYRKCGDYLISPPANTLYYDFIVDKNYLKINKLHYNILIMLINGSNSSYIKRELDLTHKEYKENILCLLQNLKQLNK